MEERIYKAVNKETNKFTTGYLVKESKTTYCFAEDYKANPDNDIYYIYYDRMSDWGLPNLHCRTEIYPETISQFTGFIDIEGNRIFEGDTFIPLYLPLSIEEIDKMDLNELRQYLQDNLDTDEAGVVEFFNGSYVVVKNRAHYIYYNLNRYSPLHSVGYVENYGEHSLPIGNRLLGIIVNKQP